MSLRYAYIHNTFATPYFFHKKYESIHQVVELIVVYPPVGKRGRVYPICLHSVTNQRYKVPQQVVGVR